MITLLATAWLTVGQLPVAVRPLAGCYAHAAPGLSAAAFGQVFAGYQALFSEAGDFNEMRLDRADLGGCVTHESGGGVLIGLEAIRSAGPDSLFGVDVDSIVIRVKHALGFFRTELGPGEVLVQAGLVPDPWIASVERRYDLRALSPLLAERGLFFDASDLGASASYSALEGRIAASAAYGNGEGRNQIEQNTGKNLTLVLSGSPLVLDLPGGRLDVTLHAAFRDGSIGVGSARNHRLAGALTVVHPRARAGAEIAHARGYRGRGEIDALGFGAWLSGTILDPWLGVAGRLDVLDANTAGAGTAKLTSTVGVFGDLVSQTDAATPFRLRLHLAWQHTTHGAAAPPLPGAAGAIDDDRLSVVLEALAFAAMDTAPKE